MQKHSSARIKVGIRVRPFLQSQLRNGYSNSRISIDPDKKQVHLQVDDDSGTNKVFQFDYTFDSNTTQSDIYAGCDVQKLVDRVLEGYHSTIFAYGQTGSGKTYTMQGVEDQSSQHIKLDGIIPRAIQQLFNKIKQQTTSRSFTVSVSFLQIYNEKIFDLLNPSSLNPKTINSNVGGLRLRWNKNQQFSVENLFVFECKSPQQLNKYFLYGLKNRINSSHKLNVTSSRSHSIFSIRVQSFDHRNPNNILSSRLELVDLAGSERIGQTGTEGKLAKESIDINKSLFTLRQVISTLAEWNKTKASKDQMHIPYRQSKLTSILKQSIGGNSYCLMIACISPNDTFLDENLSTLTYATKATMITNKPAINQDPRNKVVNQLKKQVKDLHQQLAKANRHIQLISQQQQQSSTTSPEKDRQPSPTRQKAVVNNNPDIPVFRKKFSDKISSSTYDQFSDRLVESINMVRELLKSNKQLRQNLQDTSKTIDMKDIEIFDLEKQNQHLREKLAQQANYIQQLEGESKPKQTISRSRYSKKPNTSKNLGPPVGDDQQMFIQPVVSGGLTLPYAKMSATANIIQPIQTTYNSLHSLQINQMYMNQTGMDTMPTNFNKRQINTAQGQRVRSNTQTQHMFAQRYRQTFTSSTSKRLPHQLGKNRLNHTATTVYRRNHPYS